MSHGKPITISRVEYAEPTPVKRKEVPPGQVFSHHASNTDDGDLFVALDGRFDHYVQQGDLTRDGYLLAMQISTGQILHTSILDAVYLRDADLTVGGAK